jgi:FkbM family methyltransferase
MSKILRRGVDVGVAAKAAVVHAGPQAPGQPLALQMTTEGTAMLMTTSRPMQFLKWLLRPLKPLLRPILWRLRAYMNQPLMDRLAAMEVRVSRLQHTAATIHQSTSHQATSNLQQLALGMQEQLAHMQRVMAEFERVVQARAGLGAAPDQLGRIEHYAAASARRIAINCGDTGILVRTEVGYLLCPSSDPALLAILVETGDLEPGTRLLIERLLRPGDVFVDVGANVGMHTLAAARAMRGQGRVIAFEPFEPMCRLLVQSTWMNGYSGMVEIHQAAVSSKEGVQALHLGLTSGHHSLFRLHADSSATVAETAQVRVVRLDQVLPSDLPVKLIKIDAEGAELDVLQGCADIVRANPDIALIVEFGHSHLGRSGQATGDWFAAFAQLGLQYRVVQPATGRLEEWTPAQLEQAESANLLFARPQSPAWQMAEATQ